MVITDKKPSGNNGNYSSVVCVACKPFYYPIFYSLSDANTDSSGINKIGFAIKNCIKINIC